MTTKDQRPQQSSDELSEQQLDGVAGGQEVRKMDKITVTAKRPGPQQDVVKLDKIVVSAKREDTNVASAAINTAGVKQKR